MKTFLSAVLFLVSLCSLSTGPTFAQEKKSTDATKNQAAIQIKPIETTLPNGLKLIVVEDKREPIVHYRLSFQTVSDKDFIESSMLYEFLSELLTKGTSTLTAEQLSAELTKLNMSIKTHVKPDYFTLDSSISSNNNKEFLKLFADVALNASLSETVIQAKKENMRKAEYNIPDHAIPFAVSSLKSAEALYGKHPYAYYPITSFYQLSDTETREKLLNLVTREKLLNFYKMAFVPRNALLVVVGDVKASDVTKNVSDFFGKWSGESKLSYQIPSPQARSESTFYLIDAPKVADSDVDIGFVGPMASSEDFAPMFVLTRIFDKETRFVVGPYRMASEVLLFTPKPKQVTAKDFINKVLSSVENVRSKGVTEQELAQAKEFINKNPESYSSAASIADIISENTMLALGATIIPTWRDKINAVTAADIQRVAKQYLDANKAVIVVTGDASVLLDQLKPLAKTIEAFDVKGNKKELTATTIQNNPPSTDIFEGVWNLDINFQGSPIKATLELKKQENSYKGTVKTELGDGEMTDATTNGNAIDGTIMLNMYGQNVEIKFKGVVDKDTIKGTLSPKFQGVHDLPFTGTKAK